MQHKPTIEINEIITSLNNLRGSLSLSYRFALEVLELYKEENLKDKVEERKLLIKKALDKLAL